MRICRYRCHRRAKTSHHAKDDEILKEQQACIELSIRRSQEPMSKGLQIARHAPKLAFSYYSALIGPS